MTCPICSSIASHHAAKRIAPECDPTYALKVLTIGAIIMIHCEGYEPCESCSDVYATIRRAHIRLVPEDYDATN